MNNLHKVLGLLVVMVFIGNATGSVIEEKVYSALAPCYSANVIKTFGSVPQFNEKNQVISEGIMASFENETARDTWYKKLDTLYENTKYMVDKRYSYPRGPVISYGYDAAGSVLVGIYEKEKVTDTEINEVYSAINMEAYKEGISSLPVVFFSAPMPQLDAERSDVWRPVIGGVQGDNGQGAMTIGFAATRNDQNGFVTTGHAGAVGTTVYQPNIGNSVGTITVSSEGTSSDSAWVQYSNVDAKIFETSSIQTPVWTYSDPWLNLWVTKSGITTGTTSGIVVAQTSLYNNFFDKTLYNQWYADYSATLGDSGGPVYFKDTNHRIEIAGIHWGRGSYAVFSPISSVMNDLGVSVKTS